jgi:hypothetical protein
MDAVLAFLNQPIVLTLVTLTLGSYLLSLVTDRRSRKDKLKDHAIDFLTEAGKSFNEVLPHIYRHLRTGHIAVDPAVDDALRNLFAKSMSIRIGSQAYLKSNDFHTRYSALVNELTAVVSCIAESAGGDVSQGAITMVREKRRGLAGRWPLPDESPSPDTGQLLDELVSWMDMIINRTTELLTSHLESAMR